MDSILPFQTCTNHLHLKIQNNQTLSQHSQLDLQWKIDCQKLKVKSQELKRIISEKDRRKLKTQAQGKGQNTPKKERKEERKQRIKKKKMSKFCLNSRLKPLLLNQRLKP